MMFAAVTASRGTLMRSAVNDPNMTTIAATSNTVAYPATWALRMIKLVNCCINCMPEPFRMLCRAIESTFPLTELSRAC